MIDPADIALRQEKTLPTDSAQYADHVLRQDALDAMTTPNQKLPRHIPAFRPPLSHANGRRSQRRDLPRRPQDQSGRDPDVFAKTGSPALLAVKQQSGGGPADSVRPAPPPQPAGPAGRTAGIRRNRKGLHVAACPSHAEPNSTDGDQVLSGEQRRGGLPRKTSHRLLGDRIRVHMADHQLRIRHDTGSRQGLLVAPQSLARGTDRRVVTQESDRSVATADEALTADRAPSRFCEETVSASTPAGARSTKTMGVPRSTSRARYPWLPAVGTMMSSST